MENDGFGYTVMSTVLANQKEARLDNQNTSAKNASGQGVMAMVHVTDTLTQLAKILDCRDVAFPVCMHVYSSVGINVMMQGLHNRGFTCRRATIRECIDDEKRWTTVIGLTEECQRALKRGSEQCMAVVVQNTWYPACKDVTLDDEQ